MWFKYFITFSFWFHVHLQLDIAEKKIKEHQIINSKPVKERKILPFTSLGLANIRVQVLTLEPFSCFRIRHMCLVLLDWTEVKIKH